MQFAKDILFIDFECDSIDLDKMQPTQLAAVLVDKTTLEEKNSFISFIAADISKGNPQALEISGITQEMLNGAPTPAEVAKQFVDQFGYDVILASFNEHYDRRLFKKILDSANLDYYKYDYHYLDIWPIAYTHLVKKGYTGSIRSEDIFSQFGLGPRGKHDALEDCRLASEVLRKIVKS